MEVGGPDAEVSEVPPPTPKTRTPGGNVFLALVALGLLCLTFYGRFFCEIMEERQINLDL